MTESQDTEIASPFDPLAEIRTSLGLAMNFSLGMPETEGQNPPQEYEILKQIYLKDPIVSTAIDIKSEMVLTNGWNFRGKNKRDVEKAYSEFERLNMYEVLLNFLKQVELYGDGYLEPRYDEVNGIATTKVKEVWTLETPLTRIKFDKNGKVEGYCQVNRFTPNVTGKMPEWKSDELFHYAENWFGSSVYSYSPILSVGGQFTNKVYGNNYIMQLFKNLPPKFMHILSNASKDQAANYRQALQAGKSNVNQDLVVFTTGETTQTKIMPIEVNFTSNGIVELLTYLREEVLTRMRVPPTLLGLAAKSEGRSEPQMFLFSSHIKTKQRRLAWFINKNIMPLLGLDNIQIFFRPVMFEDAEKVMAIARSMIDAGIRNENGEDPALKYLKDNGFDLPEGTEITEPKEKDIEGNPSRKRLGMSEGKDQKSNKSSTGDSSESRDKLAKAQTRSAETVVITPEEAIKMGDFESWRKAKDLITCK
ncbi:phage portal protein [Candidatus Dojkabacteria bacterium]|jgi:hypothetical protein|nr:phage portal protein [Candidatus Dojkabacteria bacterium]